MEHFIDFVIDFFAVSRDDFFSRKRDGETSMARFFCWYYLHNEKNVSVGELAKTFGRTRRNIFFGIENVKNGLKYQKYFAKIYQDMTEQYEKREPLNQ